MADVVAASPIPRRIKKPSWLDVRLAVGAALVLGSVVVGALVMGHARATVQVVVATHDLAEGSQLSRLDFQVRRVQLNQTTLARYMHSPAELVGKRLATPIRRDELVPTTAALNSPPSTSLAVPLADGMAPSLRAGVRIELWITAPACRSLVLLPAATVQSTHSLDSGFGGDSGQTVILSLDPALASRVVGALDIADAHIRAGVLTGPQPPPPPLADLGQCVTPAAGR